MDHPTMCPFTFEGKQFAVSDEAHQKKGSIRLPDGRVLWVPAWGRTNPATPLIVGIATEEQVEASPIFDAVAM